MIYFYVTLLILSSILIVFATQVMKLFRLKQEQKKRVKNYQELHRMTDSELLLFKNEMAEAKSTILGIEKVIKDVPSLEKNEVISNTLMESKSIFKQLMENPRDLTQYDNFLYRNLPTLHLLLSKYVEQSNSTEELLHLIGQNINQDYEKLLKTKQADINMAKEFIK